MPIPDFQTLMRRVLEAHTDGQDRARAPLRDALAERFDLTADERAELLPSGSQRRFDNRLAWTLTHLVQAGLLTRPSRGVTRITDRGRTVLSHHPARVDVGVLNQFEEYREFRGAGLLGSGTRGSRTPPGSGPPSLRPGLLATGSRRRRRIRNASLASTTTASTSRRDVDGTRDPLAGYATPREAHSVAYRSVQDEAGQPGQDFPAACIGVGAHGPMEPAPMIPAWDVRS